MNLLIVIIIAISLSMDAFSLSLAYGTLNLNKKNIILLSAIIGVFHFFMPLIGLFFGRKILHFLPIKPELMVFVVLGIIGIEMIIESFKKKEIKIMKNVELLLFGFAVSVDSFSVGVGLEAITNNYLISAGLFSLSSFGFAYLGLMLGKRINKLIGSLATIIGGCVLITIGFYYFIH